MAAKKTQTSQEQIRPQVKQEEVLIKWTAPARPFKRFSRDFYVTIISAAVLFAAILFLIDGVMPALLIASVVFLFYVLSTVEPEDIEYQITTWGIKTAGSRTDWNFLGRFWLTSLFGKDVLVIEAANFAGRLELVLDLKKKGDIIKILSDYSIHEETPPSIFD